MRANLSEGEKVRCPLLILLVSVYVLTYKTKAPSNYAWGLE